MHTEITRSLLHVTPVISINYLVSGFRTCTTYYTIYYPATHLLIPEPFTREVEQSIGIRYTSKEIHYIRERVFLTIYKE